MAQIFPQYSIFPLSVWFHLSSVLTRILPHRQIRETWEFSNKAMFGERQTERYFHVAFLQDSNGSFWSVKKNLDLLPAVVTYASCLVKLVSSCAQIVICTRERDSDIVEAGQRTGFLKPVCFNMYSIRPDESLASCPHALPPSCLHGHCTIFRQHNWQKRYSASSPMLLLPSLFLLPVFWIRNITISFT